jgi:membrane associated rhomboid family serine protease
MYINAHIWLLDGENKKIMNKLAKIIVTIGVLLVFFLLFGAVVGIRSATGQHTPGLLGLILFAAVVSSIRAIWKSGKTDGNDKDNGSILQK